MLSIRENLYTKEAAVAYNQRIHDYRAKAKGHPGCISAFACIHCYHVISDSICLCVGMFKCPHCGAQNGFLPAPFPNEHYRQWWLPTVNSDVSDPDDYSI